MVWLLLVPQAPVLALGPFASFLGLAPIWSTVYLPILLQLLATMALSVTNFLLPVWTPLRSYARLAIHALAMVNFLILLQADEWVRVHPGVPDAASADKFAAVVNRGFEVGLVVAMLLTVFEIIGELRRLHTRRHASPAAGSASTLVL